MPSSLGDGTGACAYGHDTAHNSRLLTQGVSWREDAARIFKDLAKNTPPEWLSPLDPRLYILI